MVGYTATSALLFHCISEHISGVPSVLDVGPSCLLACVEKGSGCIAEAGFELVGSSDPPSSAS